MTQPTDFDRPPHGPPITPSAGLAIPLSSPFVTYVLLAVIVGVWLLMEAAGGSTQTSVLIQFGANSGRHILVEGETWRLFTSMFVHIGFAHLAFNAYALFVLGIEMERIYGPVRFTTIYLLSGLFGSLASFASRGPFVLSAGASGAIFGIIGMNLAYFYLHRQAFGQVGRQRIMSTLLIIVINLIFGFTVPGIDNVAHIGGLIAGAILGYVMAPRYQVAEAYSANQHLEDTNTLAKRWWIPILTLIVLVAGVQVTISYWLNQLERL